MTDNQFAALISFGVPAILYTFLMLGYWLGTKKATRAIQAQLVREKASRIERWTPSATQTGGEPGTSERLLSDYEDAIYAEARHAFEAQFGDGDEQQHVVVAAQLHADVRRLRGRMLAEVSPMANPGTHPATSVETEAR
jgi:hypothetical protein